MNERSSHEAFKLLLPLSVLWGLNFPAMKIALAEVPPWSFRAFGLTVSAAALFAVARLLRMPIAVPRRLWGPLLLASALNIGGFQLLGAFAMPHISGSKAAMLAYTMPLWTLLFGRLFLREPVAWRQWLGLGLGLGGLMLIILPHTSEPLGMLLMTTAAIFWGAGVVAIKYFRWPMPTLVLTAWQVGLGAVPIFVGAVLFEHFDWRDISLRAALATSYVAVVSGVLCVYLWFRVVMTFPASLAALSSLAIPIFGVLSSVVVLGETLPLHVGAALVLLCAALGLVASALAVTNQKTT